MLAESHHRHLFFHVPTQVNGKLDVFIRISLRVQPEFQRKFVVELVEQAYS